MYCSLGSASYCAVRTRITLNVLNHDRFGSNPAISARPSSQPTMTLLRGDPSSDVHAGILTVKLHYMKVIGYGSPTNVSPLYSGYVLQIPEYKIIYDPTVSRYDIHSESKDRVRSRARANATTFLGVQRSTFSVRLKLTDVLMTSGKQPLSMRPTAGNCRRSLAH